MDDWGQWISLGVLARYGRVMLPRPSWAEGKGEGEVGEERDDDDEDLKLLLDCTKPMLQSRNPAVRFLFPPFVSILTRLPRS